MVIVVCLMLFIIQFSYSTSLLNLPENPSSETIHRAAADVDTIFYELFTKKNPTTPQILKLGDLDALNQSNFNPNISSKIYSHGWTGSASAGYMIRDGYMQSEIEYNFIAMDWSQMATGPLPHPTDYPFIVEVQVPKAGQNAGLFVDFLVEKGRSPLKAIHLLGHSLGSHVVGWAGATVTTGNISRITGLDPAGPFFSLNDTETRLDTTDADFVDVIHTDSGSLTDGQLTFIEAIGHIDFYPNGGVDQPGCDPLSQCDHQRVKDYYAESINNPTGFRALLCDTFDDFQAGSCAGNAVQFMGDSTPSTARGIYYLETNDKSPFALG